ncbi:MAG: ABC transporter permease subunit, partial [Salinisphaera sp.]|uniref:ABC transporter permease subunit n=1 Tax=Salinisphaera sp. TaxID=1914330 RepID=UPI003C799FA3
LIVLMVIVAPWLTPNNYFSQDYNSIWTAPTLAHGHIFGTDSVGRDLFVRTMVGGRISLMVGVVTAIVSLIIGVVYGATAGYVGGRVDGFLMRTVDVLYALPFFFFVILLVVYFGQNLFLMFIAIGAVSWLDMARIVRGQTLTIKQQPYVEAARMAGASGPAIIARHVVPNLLGLIIVYVTLTIPQVMLFESFLSYLGLGVQEPMTSWGALINDGTGEMTVAPYLLIIPSIFLAVTLFCFNFIGDGLRDALDPNDR